MKKRKSKKDKIEELNELKDKISKMDDENDPEIKAMIAELQKTVDDLIEVEKKPFIVRAFTFLFTFLIHFVLMYAVSILAITPFMGNLEVSKYFVFLISAVVSFVLVSFGNMPFKSKYNHKFTYGIIFILLLSTFALYNERIIHIFDSSYIWVIYLIIVEVAYYFTTKSLSKLLGGD